MRSEEELRTIIESLTIREIIEPALNNWIPYKSTGITVININTGKVSGISLKYNEMMGLRLKSSFKEDYIELYKIEAEEIIYEEDLLNNEEYEKYKEFKIEQNCKEIEYNPDLLDEFCKINKIDEKERKIQLLKENYEEYRYSNYQDFEHSIILNYYDGNDYTY